MSLFRLGDFLSIHELPQLLNPNDLIQQIHTLVDNQLWQVIIDYIFTFMNHFQKILKNS
jgi:hypothetical protein